MNPQSGQSGLPKVDSLDNYTYMLDHYDIHQKKIVTWNNTTLIMTMK
jgi:hypothetical protein